MKKENFHIERCSHCNAPNIIHDTPPRAAASHICYNCGEQLNKSKVVTERFPKYIRVNGTEMVRLGAPKNDVATYFRPCGEWDGNLEYKDGQYYMPIIDHNNTGKPVTISEISPACFLMANPYGYSETTKRVFEVAMRECGVNDKVTVLNDGTGKYYLHGCSDRIDKAPTEIGGVSDTYIRNLELDSLKVREFMELKKIDIQKQKI